MKKINLSVLVLSLILFSGCHSFYKIDKNELSELSENNRVQIKLESGESITIKNIKEVKIIDKLNLEFITSISLENKVDSTRLVFPINDIKEIRAERFDPTKTLFSTFWITFGLILVLVITYPEGFSVGG